VAGRPVRPRLTSTPDRRYTCLPAGTAASGGAASDAVVTVVVDRPRRTRSCDRNGRTSAGLRRLFGAPFRRGCLEACADALRLLRASLPSNRGESPAPQPTSQPTASEIETAARLTATPGRRAVLLHVCAGYLLNAGLSSQMQTPTSWGQDIGAFNWFAAASSYTEDLPCRKTLNVSPGGSERNH
jgi:hypothetical protein